jgi:integrase
MNEWTPQRIESALSGDEGTLRGLVRDLTPVVQARAARALLRRRSLARGEDPRQRLGDVAQDVYVELFRDRAKLLRSWDPARGMSLASFVGLVTEQRVAATLRSSKRNPWAEALADGDVEVGADTAAGAADPEERLLSRDAVERLLDRVRAQLSPVGLDMFYRLVIREEAIASVCAATGMSTSAVQAWSSRLKRLVQSLAHDVLAEDGATEEAKT